MPIKLVVERIGRKPTERVAGNDMIFSLLELAHNERWRVTFYGGSQSTLDKINTRLKSDYADLESQLISPPFRDLTMNEDQGFIDEINTFDPHFVLVGLGCPKQEFWIGAHLDKIKSTMFGVGGAFALFAGVDTRAPQWMRNLSLEWLYRLCLEPKRLWKRYLITNSYFIYLTLREFFKSRKG